MSDAYVHPAAMVETESIGPDTKVWASAHILSGAEVGSNCNICDLVFIEGAVTVGDGVTIKNGAMLFDGVTVEDSVFIGPGAVFTNDRLPRSPRNPASRHRYQDDSWLETTIVKYGATVGARAVVIAGVTIERFATVAAGAVVTKDVPCHALMVGVPARRTGSVCFCGLTLAVSSEPESPSRCDCGQVYQMTLKGPEFEEPHGALS